MKTNNQKKRNVLIKTWMTIGIVLFTIGFILMLAMEQLPMSAAIVSCIIGLILIFIGIKMMNESYHHFDEL